jgi:hypothetical protein
MQAGFLVLLINDKTISGLEDKIQDRQTLQHKALSEAGVFNSSNTSDSSNFYLSADRLQTLQTAIAYFTVIFPLPEYE